MERIARKPKLVIFDCDGVLVDSEPLSMRVLVETMQGLGLAMTAAECYQHFLGRSLSSLKTTLHNDFGRTITDEQLIDMRERLYTVYKLELKPIKGIAETLAGLELPFCVASSSQPDRIKLSLDLTGLAGFFGDHIYSASMVVNGKPAPDLFLLAASKMGAAPDECLVVEDSPAGIEAAGRASMRSFAFLGGAHSIPAGLRQAILPMNPTRIFERMEELPALIATLKKGE